MFHIPNCLGDFLEPSFAAAQANMALHAGAESHHSLMLEIGLMCFCFLVVLVGIVTAWFMYRDGMKRAMALAHARAKIYRLVFNKFYVDEFYLKYIVGLLKRASTFFARFDIRIIDGSVNLTAKLVDFFGVLVRVTQTGVVHAYAFWFILGALAVLWYILGG
jgi:NADH-quinone oxidoreductase subunit L